MHDVYVEPEAFEVFRRSGRWPDGVTLVKEIRSTEQAPLTTGLARYGGDLGVWFVMVKDRTRRFPGNPIWGEGWGRALFEAAEPSKNVNENWKQGDLSNCFGCHLPAKSTDWVFLQGYPQLREVSRPGQ